MLEDLLGRRDGAVYTATLEKRGYGLSDFVGFLSANAVDPKRQGERPILGPFFAPSECVVFERVRMVNFVDQAMLFR